MDFPATADSLDFIVFAQVSSTPEDQPQSPPKPPKNVWTMREIALLTQFVLIHGENFKKASEYLKEQTGIYKSAYYCCEQYHNKQSNLKRGRWSTADLQKLYAYSRQNKTAEEIEAEFQPRTVEQIRNKMKQFESEDSS